MRDPGRAECRRIRIEGLPTPRDSFANTVAAALLLCSKQLPTCDRQSSDLGRLMLEKTPLLNAAGTELTEGPACRSRRIKGGECDGSKPHVLHPRGTAGGFIDGRMFHLSAYSGGGGGSTAHESVSSMNNPYMEGLKTTGKAHLGLAAQLVHPRWRPMGRDGFYIHGRGPHGATAA